MQFFGATIGLGVAEAVFSSSLSRNLAKYAPTAPAGVIKSTPTNIYKSIPAALIPAVVKAYVKSLTPVFIIGVPLGAQLSFCGLDVGEWNSSPLHPLSSHHYFRTFVWNSRCQREIEGG